MDNNIEEKAFFDFEKEPGKLKYNNKAINKPLISVITSYYNYKDYIMQTYYSLNNQTFPYWEWIIVNDGSTEEGTQELLDGIAKLDERIKVYNKNNEGLAKGRDYGISKAMCDFIFPLDADDLIEPTVLECSYWALKTNPMAVWAYTNIVHFGKFNDLDKRAFNVETMKTNNMITATALIRKDKILELGGYSIAKRYVNEDWHLWLRMLQNGYFPVELGFYGFWYRRKPVSLLTWINSDDNDDNEKRKLELKEEAEKINKEIIAKIYPNMYDYDNILNDGEDVCYDEINEMIQDEDTILYITSNLSTDKYKIDLVKKMKESNYKIIIITTRSYIYTSRQEYEQYAEVYDLSTFLDKKYWKAFIEYIYATRNIKKTVIVNCNLKIDVEHIVKKLSNGNYEKLEYEEDDHLFYEKLKKYKKDRTLLRRILNKLRKGC